MITRKLKKLLYLLKNNKKSFISEQIILFDKFNLNRENGKELLNNIKKQYPILNTTMNSEHQTIFSSISENKKYVIKNILEIGTYDGTNAFLLSKLFPQAKILTIDLPDDAKDFQDTYGRNDEIKRENFIKLRKEVLELGSESTYTRNCIFENEKFDLIWVDGAHGYPQVTIDIINSLRLCNQNGLIFMMIFLNIKLKINDLSLDTRSLNYNVN